MEMISERSKESMYSWNKTAEKGDFEAVEALMTMSCSWKSDLKKYKETRPVTPASDLSEEESLVPGTPDFHTIPAFVSVCVEIMGFWGHAGRPPEFSHALACAFLFPI